MADIPTRSRGPRRSLPQAQKLASVVRRRIQRLQLPDGAFFMTEAQLATRYRVSRTVAREAVSQLKALGLLESRKRKGLLVRRPDPLGLLSTSLPSLATSPDDWHELAQLRYALEVGAIELAVRNATTDQIKRLETIEQQLEVAIATNVESPEAARLDMQFHAWILQMTGSKLIAGMQQVLEQFFRIAPRAPQNPASAQRITWEHRELFLAIRDRDVERARLMIRMQFQSTLAAAAISPTPRRKVRPNPCQ
jgi:DNA-binding FadR family transcriptional regulator